MRIRPATAADLPRIHEVRTGIAENPLEPGLVTPEEVEWYLREGVFLVAEAADGVQGFCCADPQTGYVWALFVIDGRQGRGMGTALLEAALARLREAGHRQAFLHTSGRPEAFYAARGWRAMGQALCGEIVYRLWL